MSSEPDSPPSTPRPQTLLVFADSLSYYGPQGGLPADDPRIWPNIVAARLGWECELIGRIGWTCRDVLVGRHPGSAGLGRTAAGRGGDLRDLGDGFAAVAAADCAARVDPLPAAGHASPLGS